jgi:transketolase
VLYELVMKYDCKNPSWADRDKFVLSKGHSGPALYAALALKGFFPYEELETLNKPHTILPSHCDRNKTPGVDMTTGSLGQGASTALGMALGDMLKGRNTRVYLMTGDGEIDEGQAWEAAMFAGAHKINNFYWMVDFNKKQLDGTVCDILDSGNLEEKFRSFGFDACTIDGHDYNALYEALTKKSDRPVSIILDTVKGKGIKQVEETADNHSMTVTHELAAAWRAELQEALAQLD